MAPDLIFKGQEIVVHPQAMHGSHEQLCEVVHELNIAHAFEIWKTTLVKNLER